MPLPTPTLDDRRFQDIVDQAKKLIPQFCPDWTDHNVSDPGVTLIELMAWMTDMLLYRVNQVPDKAYIAFLEMIGLRLKPPRSARGPITFYLAAALPMSAVIAEGTEVGTVRTGASASVIFTTETELVIRPPRLTGAYTETGLVQGSVVAHDLRQLELLRRSLVMFPANPAPNDAFYISFADDHSNHLLALVLDCEMAGGAGVRPDDPPIVWEVCQHGATDQWARCEVEKDGTGGFNWSGEVWLHLPAMALAERFDKRGYWLRCRLTDAQARANSYRVSPEIESMRVEARGGTVQARHAVTVTNEILGVSDGSPGQQFTLRHTPILSRDPVRDRLIVEPPGGRPECWTEVTEFGSSGPTDEHYTLDPLDGALTLGPSLLQPEGTVYQFGAVPPRGSRLSFSRYQYGGGVAGNVPASALSVLKSSIPYVARVTNRAPSVGGLDAQTLEDAKLHAPEFLRTRTRAVTADDYEYLASQVDRVARACCIAPQAQPGAPGDPAPGQVRVVLLPQVDAPARYIPKEQMAPPPELISAVEAHLSDRRLVGTSLEIRGACLCWVTVEVRIRIRGRTDLPIATMVQRYALDELYRYLNPYVGGTEGRGWEFGHPVHVSEVFGLLQKVPEADFVEDIQIYVSDSDSAKGRRLTSTWHPVPRDGVVCSGRHQVTITRESAS